MIERKVYGPISFQAPIKHIRAVLNLSGVERGQAGFATHVFLEEVKGDDIEALKTEYNYAGCLSSPWRDDQAELDITESLQKAVQNVPNFHITFLTQYDASKGRAKAFDFKSLEIVHVVPNYTALEVSARVTGGVVPRTVKAKIRRRGHRGRRGLKKKRDRVVM